jgi:hypothetical protein
MPARQQVLEEIIGLKAKSQDSIRRKYLAQLSEYTKRDTILYASAFSSKKLPQLPSFLVSITTEDIQGFMSALHELKGKELDLILHSPGGSLEAADQIVQYLRSKYQHIRAIIPQNAMSAATMIACACDSIVMGKHSAIGPIDPQITFPAQKGHFTAPAQAILDEFAQAKQEVLQDPRVASLWIGKIQSYPHGFLHSCQNAIALSKEKVAEWLDAYMFAKDADKKGKAISDWLGDNREHKTHGRPIGIAKAREIGLRIEALEDDQELQERVLSVFHATMITLEISDCMKLVENHLGKGWFVNVKVEVTKG